MRKYTIYIVCLLTAGTANAAEINKNDWINSMTTALPTVFCQPHQYFRQCFKVTPEQCEKTAMSTTRICLNKYAPQLPAVLQQPKDGQHWGSRLGSCAGEAYELALLDKRIDSEKCNNIDNWK